MAKNQIRFLVDIFSFCLLLTLMLTGSLMHFFLPPGSGRFRTLLGMSRHQWGELHFWIAVLLLASITIHLILHWKWIVCMFRTNQNHMERPGKGETQSTNE